MRPVLHVRVKHFHQIKAQKEKSKWRKKLGSWSGNKTKAKYIKGKRARVTVSTSKTKSHIYLCPDGTWHSGCWASQTPPAFVSGIDKSPPIHVFGYKYSLKQPHFWCAGKLPKCQTTSQSTILGSYFFKSLFTVRVVFLPTSSQKIYALISCCSSKPCHCSLLYHCPLWNAPAYLTLSFVPWLLRLLVDRLDPQTTHTEWCQQVRKKKR